MDQSPDIRFDGWTLRRQPPELLRGDTRVRLQDQPLLVLEELLTHPGELVTRERLIARLWPKRVVDFDTALNATVRRLRAALGDEAETPRYIETVPRHGYRFIGTITAPTAATDSAAVQEEVPPRPASRRWPYGVAVAALLVLMAVPLTWFAATRRDAPAAHDPSKSIVVLPFADLSPEGDQEYFADGLTEELLNSLAQSKNLRVIARTSSFSFKGRNVDIATVARQLGVTHVLEGSVRKWGDRVRITAQLVDAAHSSHLWSQTYDRELREVLTVQSDIAHSVAAALEVALGAGHSGGAPDPQAYEHYLRAHFFVHRRAPGDLERARSYYERAIETDPTYARAWAGLAGAYWLQIHEGDIDGEAGLQKVRAAAERALALDPHQVEAHLRMTNFYWSTGDLQMKMQHQRQAEALAPDHPLLLAFEASQTADKGQWVEAIALQRRVVAADPLSVMSQGNLAVMLLFAGQIEDVTEQPADRAAKDMKDVQGRH